ncbi:MAG TPA: S-methyl-5-thioribose-1-phosphate isomerase [Tepidiformaceae bacterium]|nr:S-methyl-5-thioribose-1-phosphate isomerase [Tepidiformaceae bacterium]
MREIVPIRIEAGVGIEILDQTLLPLDERYISLTDLEALCEAIRTLRIRGAPLLGIAGACGMAIAAQRDGASDEALDAAARAITATRPTAVDLGVAVQRARSVAKTSGTAAASRQSALWDFACEMLERRRAEDQAMGEAGADLIARASTVLTHCNTGALATGGIGTALGVIRCAWEAETLERCFVTETRPLLQGARLTAWELTRLGIPTTLLPDSAVPSLLASDKVGAVLTGADRIAANGDTANKIGTYGLAVVAARHGVPFYIAAPRSTFDAHCPDGTGIPIEFRDPGEVGGYGETRWAPEGVDAYNPAFDVTPAELITGFITEHGVLRPPFRSTIETFCEEP